MDQYIELLTEKAEKDVINSKKGEIFGYMGSIAGSFIENTTNGDHYYPYFYIDSEPAPDDFQYPLIFQSNGNGTAKELISGKTFFIGKGFGLLDQELKNLYFYDEEMKKIEEKSKEQPFYTAYKEIRKNPLTTYEGDFYEVDDNFLALYKITYDKRDKVSVIIHNTEAAAKLFADERLKKSIDRIHDYALMENFIYDKTKTR